MTDPNFWQNDSPGNLQIRLPITYRSEVSPAVTASLAAFPAWAKTPLRERQTFLEKIRADLVAESESLARAMSLEMGKTLTEARGEMTAVVAKFSHSFEDADRFLADLSIENGPHPAEIRRRPRGPAAIVGPFNFPLHLANGAILPHLLAGNPILFKPSPFASVVAESYGKIFARHLPPDVFQIVQGFGETSRELCCHRDIRSICFTGSVAVGRQLALELAGDFSKDLALELGGKNALFVAADADLAAAALAAADGVCLTTGQRCNGTSRIFVDSAVAKDFEPLFRQAMSSYRAGDPLSPETKLGPVISAAARERHETLVRELGAEVFGEKQGGLNGHFVQPAAVWRKMGEPLISGEQFVPLVEIIETNDLAQGVALQNETDFGLAAAIFTKTEETFRWFADAILVGNIYANLPTTFSPSTLPFGGLKNSGNHHPGGKGFSRFVADEQAVQWLAWKN